MESSAPGRAIVNTWHQNRSRLVAEGLGDLYSIRSSKLESAVVPEASLDVDNGLPLICEAGEPFIWLDLRTRPHAVRMCVGNPPEWRVIATTFVGFLQLLLGTTPL